MIRPTAMLAMLALFAPGCAVRGYLDFKTDMLLDVPSIAETPAPVQIRPATAGDADAVSAFFDQHLRADAWIPRALIRDVIERADHELVIAVAGDQIIGVALAAGSRTLTNLLVHPLHRGAGIGTALLNHVDPDAVRVKVDMSTGNPTAYYLSHGFRPTLIKGRGARVHLFAKPGAGYLLPLE